ncbi:MAG: helix-turn-helix transcriptional regulator [Deltaproteobacteria bacterium]|nr:helix-turn-helix transcriptional regulator [Deltaproteobacteria bacterium]
MGNFVKKKWPPKTYFQCKLWNLIEKEADGRYVRFAKKAGISTNAFKNYITGTAKPKQDALRKICKVGGINPSYFEEYKNNEAALNIADFKRRNGDDKNIKIEGAEYSVKELMKMAREVLISDHPNANILAYNLVSFINSVREDKENKYKKNNSAE